MTTILVVQDGTATYLLEPVTEQQAADVGCPWATHRYTGNHGTVYGQWVETSGKPVRIRRQGWTNQLGVHGAWTVKSPMGSGSFIGFKGWAHG